MAKDEDGPDEWGVQRMPPPPPPPPTAETTPATAQQDEVSTTLPDLEKRLQALRFREGDTTEDPALSDLQKRFKELQPSGETYTSESEAQSMPQAPQSSPSPPPLLPPVPAGDLSTSTTIPNSEGVAQPPPVSPKALASQAAPSSWDDKPDDIFVDALARKPVVAPDPVATPSPSLPPPEVPAPQAPQVTDEEDMFAGLTVYDPQPASAPSGFDSINNLTAQPEEPKPAGIKFTEEREQRARESAAKQQAAIEAEDQAKNDVAQKADYAKFAAGLAAEEAKKVSDRAKAAAEQAKAVSEQAKAANDAAQAAAVQASSALDSLVIEQKKAKAALDYKLEQTRISKTNFEGVQAEHLKAMHDAAQLMQAAQASVISTDDNARKTAVAAQRAAQDAARFGRNAEKLKRVAEEADAAFVAAKSAVEALEPKPVAPKLTLEEVKKNVDATYKATKPAPPVDLHTPSIDLAAARAAGREGAVRDGGALRLEPAQPVRPGGGLRRPSMYAPGGISEPLPHPDSQEAIQARAEAEAEAEALRVAAPDRVMDTRSREEPRSVMAVSDYPVATIQTRLNQKAQGIKVEGSDNFTDQDKENIRKLFGPEVDITKVRKFTPPPGMSHEALTGHVQSVIPGAKLSRVSDLEQAPQGIRPSDDKTVAAGLAAERVAQASAAAPTATTTDKGFEGAQERLAMVLRNKEFDRLVSEQKDGPVQLHPLSGDQEKINALQSRVDRLEAMISGLTSNPEIAKSSMIGGLSASATPGQGAARSGEAMSA